MIRKYVKRKKEKKEKEKKKEKKTVKQHFFKDLLKIRRIIIITIFMILSLVYGTND